jgi:hypothetical protein
MAFSVGNLTNYTKEEQTQLLVKAMFSGKTSALLSQAGQVVTGVKSSQALPILSSTILFQADGCSNTTSGTTTITDRDITVGKVKVFENLCPKDLEAKYTQIGLSAGAPVDLGVFQSQIGDEKAMGIAEAIETAIWQGNTSGGTGNNAFWDGFLTILTGLGFGGAGDPVQGNPTTGGGWTQLTSLTSSNIDDAITKIYSLIPTGLLGRSDLFLAMGTDTFRTYRSWLVSANLYHYNANEAANLEILDPISGIKIYGLPGMDGTNKIVCSYWANFFLGTDMMSEEEQYKFWYSEDDDIVKFKANFKYGCQIAFPDQVVYFVI